MVNELDRWGRDREGADWVGELGEKGGNKWSFMRARGWERYREK